MTACATTSSTPPRQRLLVALVMALAVLISYRNSFSVPLLLDDPTTIASNPSIRQLWPLSSVLFPPPEIYSAGRPLLNLSFALNYAIGGTSVTGYHVVNLLIHFVGGLALFGLVGRTLRLPSLASRYAAAATPLAFTIALLWLLHPVQTASVTYLSQRAESLMGMFYLLTLYAFVRGVTSSSVAWGIAMVVACACGMATKEVMVTAPVVALLYDRQFVSGSFRAAWQRHRGSHLALASTWLILAALMLSSKLEQRGIGLGHSISRLDYLRIECSAVTKYLELSVWPHPLVFDYGPQVPVPSGAALLIPATLLLALLIGSLVALRRSRPIGFAGCVFFLLLAPSSSIVPVAGQPIAENRLYLPLALVMISGVTAVHAAVAARRLRAAAAAVLILCAWLTYRRNGDFQSDLSIWRDTVAKRPANVRAWPLLSVAQIAAGQKNEALATALTALRHFPDSAEFYNNAGVFLYQVGRVPEAIAHLRTAVRLNPDYGSAYHSLARVLFETNDLAGANESYAAILRLEPNDAEAHNFLGVGLVRTGRVAEAIPHFEAALRIRPDFREARINLETFRAPPR